MRLYRRPYGSVMLRGDGGGSERRGDFDEGPDCVRRSLGEGGRAAAQTNENGRRAVAPSEGAQATERGWVCPPADDPQKEGGASERGAPGGKPRRGKPQPPASPPRQSRPALPTPAARRRGWEERPQRRARSPAGDVTARPRAGAAPGRASSPASASERTFTVRPPLHHNVKYFFPLREL